MRKRPHESLGDIILVCPRRGKDVSVSEGALAE